MSRLLVLWLAVASCTCGCATRQPPPPQAGPSQALLDEVEAARRVVQILDQRKDNDEPLTVQFLTLSGDWSRRLRDLEIESAIDRAGKRDAAMRHLQRCEKEDEAVRHILDGYYGPLSTFMRYNIAEAKVVCEKYD